MNRTMSAEALTVHADQAEYSLDLASFPVRVQSCPRPRRVTLARRPPHDCIKQTNKDSLATFRCLPKFSSKSMTGHYPTAGRMDFKCFGPR
jgi:hypothetical protein